MRDCHRRLAGGRNAVDVGGFAAGIGHRIERSVDIQLDLRHVGDDAGPGGWAAPIMAIDVGIIAGYLPRRARAPYCQSRRGNDR